MEPILKAEKYLPPEGILVDCHFNRFTFDAAADDKWLNDDDWKEDLNYVG